MLDDPKSNRVKRVARLHQKDARSETGLFLLEGPQGLKELSNNPEFALEVFATSSALGRYQSEFQALEGAGVQISEVTDLVLEKMADTQNPQGVVAVLHQLDVELEELLDQQPKLLAILEQARDPGNVGAVIRVADAAGADGVLLTEDSVDLYNSKLVRATAGSILHLPTAHEVPSSELFSKLRSAGIQIFATAASGQPLPELSEADLAKPTAWIFGNEAHGVSKQALESADQIVSLPIYGAAESLNLATAASVCLYASAFAQRASR